MNPSCVHSLQNFRKTQKTAKQIQLAKQAAAIQAQKNSTNNGVNSTYQAFDLQNYKSRKYRLLVSSR